MEHYVTAKGVAVSEHAGTGPGVLVWRMSPWDGLVHGFRSEQIGEVTAEAMCTHSTPANQLTDNPGRLCQACVLLHGHELASRHGEADWYVM